MKHKGFTLLEVLLATLILTVGVVMLMWAFSSGMYATTDVENMDLALNIAQAKMEYVFQDLKDTNLTTLDIPSYEISNSGTDPNFSNFSVTLNLQDQNPPNQDRLTVDVTVAWNVKGGSTNITLMTLVANYN